MCSLLGNNYEVELFCSSLSLYFVSTTNCSINQEYKREDSSLILSCTTVSEVILHTLLTSFISKLKYNELDAKCVTDCIWTIKNRAAKSKKIKMKLVGDEVRFVKKKNQGTKRHYKVFESRNRWFGKFY